MTEIEPKIAFDHLHQTLVEYQARFVDVGMKGAGLAALLLGWLLASKEARAFIAASIVARCAAVAGTTLMAAAGVFLFARISHGMRHVEGELDALRYLPRSYYSFRVPSTRASVAISTLALAPWAISVVVMLFGLG